MMNLSQIKIIKGLLFDVWCLAGQISLQCFELLQGVSCNENNDVEEKTSITFVFCVGAFGVGPYVTNLLKSQFQSK